MTPFFVFVTIFSLMLTLICGDAVSPELTIRQGKLRGKYLNSTKGRTFSSFTAIPYVQPPVGQLRFEPPRAAKRWKGTLDATKSHPACPQVGLIIGNGTFSGQEDCLYLNVYTPEIKFPTKKSLPVMIFFHGGGFMFGNANHDLYGPELLLNKNVVLVVPNYRLGPLGFLSTGDKVVPGNNGLKDQNEAIKWVKRNIVSFGGDSDRITLFGQSPGASSVEYHMISPLSKNLIKGAMALSGAATAPWVLSANGETQINSRKLASMFNCPVWNSKDMVKCLKEVDVKELTLAENEFYQWEIYPLTPFKAVIEPNIRGAMLPQSPIDAIKSGKIARVPFVIGVNTENGAFLTPAIFNNPALVEDLNDNFTRIAPALLQYYNTAVDKDYVSRKIKKFYFGNGNITQDSRQQVGKMLTEGLFVWSVNDMARLHFEYSKNPTYYYVFGYRGSVSFCNVLDPSRDYGVCILDELIYLLPSKQLYPNYQPTREDTIMSDILTTLWVNFATTGKPTPRNDPIIPSKWKRIQTKNLEYYLIRNSSYLKMNRRWNEHSIKFWESLPIYPNFNLF